MKVRVYTDGSCSRFNQFGGYSALLRVGLQWVEGVYGGALETTNNRMELCGILAGLRLLYDEHERPRFHEPVILSDSKYCVQGARDWVYVWCRNGWRTSAGTKVLNQDLWEELLRLTVLGPVDFAWVKGHVGERGNEAADRWAGYGRSRVTQTGEAFEGPVTGKIE